MAIGVYFAFPSMTTEKYDEGVRRLAAEGLGNPPGRQYHVAFSGGPGIIHVFDVWESQESFDAFGRTLMPIMNELGIDPGQPQITEVHNIITG
jgi:hypothetical protein